MKSIEYFWKIHGFSPNEFQKNAILFDEGPLYLPAGPGSGKTRVLLWRTFNLIVYRNIKPEEIFLSTFTRKAATQLKEGLHILLSYASAESGISYDIGRMYIGTIHSLCQKLLQERRISTTRERHRPPIIMDELTQFFYLYQGKGFRDIVQLQFDDNNENPPLFFYQRINQLLGKNSGSKFNAITNLVSFFNRISEEAPSLSEWKNTIEKVDDKEFLYLLEIYEEYLKSLSDSPSRTDLSLLQQATLKYLQQSDNAQNVFKHVIIDEYQDTNTVQEKIVFELSKGFKNICVVGDDDQALYRFRGATVENFVQFPERVKKYLFSETTTIPLVTNYRSQKNIVETYTRFMQNDVWVDDESSRKYRVEKNINSYNTSSEPCVFKTSVSTVEDTAEEIADKVAQLIKNGVVDNPNKIAFLFPSLGGKAVTECKEALERRNLRIYAPRAGTFLATEEAKLIFGLFAHIFGKFNSGYSGREINDFKNLMDESFEIASDIIENDPLAALFIKQKHAEIDLSKNDYAKLLEYSEKKKLEMETPVDNKLLSELSGIHGLSEICKKTLISKSMQKSVERRILKNDPFNLKYIINSATALDWTLLDLFYRIMALDHFRNIVESHDKDEAPLYNLSLVAQYIDIYLDEFKSIITAYDLEQKRIVHSFFGSYLYNLYRRHEREFENDEVPFPKGRIPFLTIHQSKGLEFPVVVMGSFKHKNRVNDKDEKLSIVLSDKEPLQLQPTFDSMRKYYVAMSRAKNLLIINNAKSYVSIGYKDFLKNIPELSNLSIESVKKSIEEEKELPKTYSFTSDYNFYRKCPLQYMIFKKFEFPPSRSQSMVFGSLVHQTIEDLHEFLISRRNG